MATAEGWATIRTVMEERIGQGATPVIVASALSGVSDLLEEACHEAQRGREVDGLLETLRGRHEALARDLGVAVPDTVRDLFDELAGCLQGALLVREVTPRLRARILSFGERLSTRLGVHWLAQRGVAVEWVDARTLLTGIAPAHATDERRYLSAVVDTRRDESIEARLAGATAVLTQGFIAQDAEGDTVLLGRGGSDTSAAYFGALLGAERVEIWTDVPGLFSMNPARSDEARFLPVVGYDEAEMLASLGGRVLHPRCIGPARRAGIPLQVRSTYRPDLAGTVVHGAGRPGLKAVTSRGQLAMVVAKRPWVWQPVGFLADVTAAFKRHGVSVDLLSTSPSTLLATIDPSANPLSTLDPLLDDLGEVCEASVVPNVASVSVVGTEIQASLESLGVHLVTELGSAVHMVSHGASDHHMSFVVDEAVAEELEAQLHALLFERTGGLRWRTLSPGAEAMTT